MKKRPPLTFADAAPRAAFLPPAEVLVVDDEPPVAELLGELLTLMGHRATRCHSPDRALALLAEQDFDLIISDYRMPQMDGSQFFRAVASTRPDLVDRIVFLTGDYVGEDTQVFLKSTGNPYLSKPFRLAAVEKVVDQVLQALSSLERRRRAAAAALA